MVPCSGVFKVTEISGHKTIMAPSRLNEIVDDASALRSQHWLLASGRGFDLPTLQNCIGHIDFRRGLVVCACVLFISGSSAQVRIQLGAVECKAFVIF